MLIYPASRSRISGGSQGGESSTFQGVNEWVLNLVVTVGIPKMGQTTSPLMYQVDDYIDNIVLDFEDTPIGVDELPEDIKETYQYLMDTSGYPAAQKMIARAVSNGYLDDKWLEKLS